MRMYHALFLALALASSGAAQSASLVARNGDSVPGAPGGGGFLGAPKPVRVDDQGRTTYQARITDSTLLRRDTLLRDGSIIVQAGQPVTAPPGYALGDILTISDAYGDGQAVLLTFLDDSVESLEGITLNTKTILHTGSPAFGPFSPGATYSCVGNVSSGVPGQVLVRADVVDGTRFLPTVQILDLDAQGDVVETKTFMGPTTPYPPDDCVEQTLLALNRSGDAFYTFDDTPFFSLYLNDDLVAQKDGPSTVPGVDWRWFQGGELNDAGEVVFHGRLRDGRAIVSTASRPVILSGDNVPDIAPATFNGFGNIYQEEHTPHITSAGEVVYLGTWRDPDPQEGLFFEGELTVQNGATMVNGVPPFLSGSPIGQILGFDVSPGGRYMAFGTLLADGSQAVCLLDLGRVTPISGCLPSLARLGRSEGFAVAGSSVTLAMDGAQSSGALSYLMVSDRAATGYPPCGLPLPFGELVIDFGSTNPFLVLGGAPWSGGEVPIDLAIQNNPLLVDQVVYAQGLFVAPGTAEPLRLTNALEIEIGAP